MTRQANRRPAAIRSAAALLISASTLALASVPTQAAEVLFAANGQTQIASGATVTATGGIMQVKTDDGATLSFSEGSQFRLNADGSVELLSGEITVAGSGSSDTRVIMPDGTSARVVGGGSSASFAIDERGQANGHTLTGSAWVSRGGREREFSAGEMWASSGRNAFRQVMARGSRQAPPSTARIARTRDEGPVGAAQNGQPVSLGDALAGAGASSDIVGAARRVEAAATNPQLEAFPTGDLAQLVALAARLENLYGGTPFPQAQADIIRAYLGHLADGGAGNNFLAAYSGFLSQYLDLIRAGGLPAGFDAASLADINAFLAYQGRVGALSNLGAQDAALAQAYLDFLLGGGNGADFSGQFTDLIEAYFSFVQGGGDPAQFTGASQDVLDAYIAFLNDSGLIEQLSSQYQQILLAYLAGGGFDFANQYGAALQAYLDFLQQGNLPSQYDGLDPEVVRAYLETLQASGLFDQILGAQAQFFADYLAYLQGGGNPDDYTGLPTVDLPAYADALNAYAQFLAAGGLPSDFTGADLTLLANYLRAISNNGQLDALLGANAGLLQAYFDFLASGGNADLFTGLPVYSDYLAAIADFYAFIAAGGLPSAYTLYTQEQIEAYLASLANLGLLSGSFGGDELDFYVNYLAYLGGGGIPDQFGDLPVNSGTFNGFALAQDAKGYVISQGLQGSVNTAGGSINAQGQPTGFSFQPVGEMALDVGGNDDGVLGRFASNNLHYVIINPIIGSLPASGAIDYEVVAATAPTYSDGATAPGTFDANLTIGFGTSLTYGIDGTITMPDATYTFASPGRANGDLVAPQVADPGFFVIRPDLSQTGSACQSSDCYLNMFGAIGGNAGETAGFSYHSRDLFNLGQPFVQGSVIFGATGPVAGPDVTKQNQSFAFANPLIGDDIHTDIEVTYNSAGIPVGYVSDDVNEALTFGDMTLADTGTADGVLGWARWNDGTPGGTWYGTPDRSVGVDGGYHVIAGDDLSNMPASGAVEYDIVGFTTPTRHDESTSTGSVAGGAAVVFGVNPVVALDLEITSGIDVFDLFTAGRLTDPAQSGLAINQDGMFHTLGFDQYGVSSSKNAIFVESASSFCDPDCTGFVEGFLAGDGASHMGLAYSIRDNAPGQTFIDGSVAFAKGDPISLGGGSISLGTVYYIAQTPNSLGFGLGGPAEVSTQGVISSFKSTGTFVYTPGNDATVDVAGRFGDDVAFTRYNQTIEPSNFYTNGTNDYLVGLPASGLPASGTVNYLLLDGAAPANALAANGERGRFEGSLAVSFGANPMVGISMDVWSGTRGYHAQTAGGSADPTSGGLAVNAGMDFNGSLQVTGTAGIACASSCSSQVFGSLYGSGAAYAGFTYYVNDAQTNQAYITGTAIFGTNGTQVDGLGTMPGGNSSSSQGDGSAVSLARQPDWDRWQVPSEGITADNGIAAIAPGLEAAAAMGIEFSPEQLQMLETYHASRSVQ